MFFRKIKVFAGIFVVLFITSLSAFSADNFYDALGDRETGGYRRLGFNSQYEVINDWDFIGKYQFGEAILHDLGYFNSYVGYYPMNGRDGNSWDGKWTGKNGVRDIRDILGHKSIQEKIIMKELIYNVRVIKDILGIDSLTEYVKGNRYARRNGYTVSGILAGAHLCGAGAVVDFLEDGIIRRDELGTEMTEYMDRFSGYHLP